ncbi:protein RRP5 homolog [Ciona intestinalis]
MSEICFPRGKPTTTTTQKRKFQENGNENLFTENRFKSSDKKDKKIRKKEKDLDEEIEDEIVKKQNVEVLQFKKVEVGMLLVGCVKDIYELELVMCLPDHLIGYVKATRISQTFSEKLEKTLYCDETTTPLSEIFKVGELLVCSVASVNPVTKSLQLSIDPKCVNANLNFSTLQPGMFVAASVKSKEDHGFQLDVGKDGTSGFLPLKHKDPETHLPPGGVIRCVIVEVKNDGKILILSNDKKRMNKTLARLNDGITLDSMFPGTLVKFNTTKELPFGKFGKFLQFEGSVSCLNADNRSSDVTIKHDDKNNFLTACVMYVTCDKHVALSTNPVLWRDTERLQLVQQFQEKYSVGTKCLSSVVKMMKGIGVVCKIDNNGPSAVIFKRNLSDKISEDILDEWNGKKNFESRVINFCSVNMTLELSAKRSVLDAKYLRYEDIIPGTLVQCKIIQVQQKGLQVVLGSGEGKGFKSCNSLMGFVSKLHLSDIILQHPEKIFNEGNVIKCRVLTTSAKRRHLHLTHKQSLVGSKLPIVTNYDVIKRDDLMHGFISNIKPFGCFVKFYDDVTGFVPHHQLSATPVQNPQKLFFIGQVVKCRVISNDAGNKKLKLSFRTTSEKRVVEHNVTPGMMVNVEVTMKEQSQLSVKIIGDESERSDWPTAMMSQYQLSDFDEISRNIFTMVREEMVLNDCIVVATKQQIQVSRKHSLVERGSKVNFCDLIIGQLLRCFVRQVTSYGVFVETVGGLVGLCPKSAICDKYLADVNDRFMIGQSVVAVVTGIEDDRKRFLVSLRTSQCSLVDEQPIISQYSDEIKKIKKFFPKDKLKVGDVVTVVTKNGTRTIEGIPGFEVRGDITEGSTAIVVHKDFATKVLFVTNETSVVDFYSSSKQKVKETFERQTRAQVLFVNDDIIMGFVVNNGRLVQVFRKNHWNEKNVLVEIGQNINIEIIQRKNLLLGKIQESSSDLGDFPLLDISVGSKVRGEVTSIRATTAIVKLTSLPIVHGRHQVGRIHASEVFEECKPNVSPMNNLKVGDTISCTVIGVRDVMTHRFLEITNRKATRGVIELSLWRSAPPPSDNIGAEFSVGKKKKVFVKNFDRSRESYLVEVRPGVRGFVPKLLALDGGKMGQGKMKQGRCVECNVVKHGDTIMFACRGLYVCSTVVVANFPPLGALINGVGEDVCDITVGHVTNGEIREIVADGALVRMELRGKGKLFSTDISDEFVDGMLKKFRVGQIIRCRVIGRSSKGFVLTMRKSLMHETCDLEPVDRDICDITDVKPKQIIRGIIKVCSESGIFVTLSRCVHGRVTFANASKYYVSDHKEAIEIFYPGRIVHCCVISVSPHDGRVELSMLKRDTGHCDIINDENRFPLRRKRKLEETATQQKCRKTRILKSEPKSSVEILIKQSEFNEDNIKVATTVGDCDVIEPGFVWDDDVTIDSNKEDIMTTDDEICPKIKVNDDEPPESAVEWEKLLLLHHNESMLWIRFMAFHLKSKEIEKARNVAEKSLTLIDRSAENERLNIWSALLNLENKYGCDVTMKQTMDRALKCSDQLKVYFRVVKIYEESGKKEKAGEMLEKMTTKFRQNKEVWLAHMRHLMEESHHQEAQESLKRSLLSLPKKQNLEIISKFAQMEFTFGEAERGRTMFENILENYRKRTDIWSMYVDALVKVGMYDAARDVFTRVTSLSLSSKKMKSFYRRFVDFETKHGNDDDAKIVKEKALKYAESLVEQVMAE